MKVFSKKEAKQKSSERGNESANNFVVTNLNVIIDDSSHEPNCTSSPNYGHVYANTLLSLSLCFRLL